MRKLCSNKSLLLSLITAFLFLQWSATHIHLAGEHAHDDGPHQHAVVAHQHQSTSHHADAIDIADDTFSHSNTSKVIELEHVCTQFHGNLGKLFAVIPFTEWNNFQNQAVSNSVVTPVQTDTYQNYHQYTSIRLRAPPVIS